MDQACMDDEAFAEWLGLVEAPEEIIMVQGGCVLKFARSTGVSALTTADPGTKSKRKLKALAKAGRLRVVDVTEQDAQDRVQVDPIWTFNQIDEGAIKLRLDERDQALGRGRGPRLPNRIVQEVWADARGVCMFQGCAEDLTHIDLGTVTARTGYLAHIVASDPNGPRGGARSRDLSDKAHNIMLLCDKHHRLIDVIEPFSYSEERLIGMRTEHTRLTRSLCTSLKYPRYRAIAFLADLGGVPTHFPDREYRDALLATGALMLPDIRHSLRRTHQSDDRTDPAYWPCYLREHKTDILELVGRDKSQFKGGDGIAVFPMHHVPTLVLVGRIIGEGQAIKVFQRDRGRGSWTWPEGVEPKPSESFTVDRWPDGKFDEVVISAELTASVATKAMPTGLSEEVGSGSIPWIRIQTPMQGQNCISHPKDLEQFRDLARKLINHVQDRMRVKTIHLFAPSPASGVFALGQVLQAGHHARVITYDRPTGAARFKAALIIDGLSVSSADDTTLFSIPIQ